MNTRLLSLMSAAVILGGCGGTIHQSKTPGSVSKSLAAATPARSVKRIDAFADAVRRKHGLPAVTVAVFGSKGISAQGVSGVRRLDGKAVTVNDRFHIGSCTKAMTATLAARLVEAGQLKWTDTLKTLFPTYEIHPKYQGVTVEELLRHEGGFPSSLPGQAPAVWRLMLSTRVGRHVPARQVVARRLLKKGPMSPTGQFAYSNAGYIVLGAALERRQKRAWEALVHRHVFKPLGMSGCGFGAPATTARPEQPWGHYKSGGKFQPIPPGRKADNPPVLGPAGTVHCDMGSWVRFLGLHLGTGPRDYLSSDTLKRLHTANPKSKYAYGWLSPVPGVLTHAGSNEMNYAEVILLQRKKMGFIIATNSGPTKVVSRAINRAFPSLIRRYLKRKRRPKKAVPPTP